MTARPKVSIIVPNYNHARFLRQRVDSVLAQTFQDFEVILLDDCSTDESRSIISSYATDPRVRIEINEVNSGNTFKQWNRGVGLARGEYVWIAESDDYADERLLQRLVSALEAEPEITLSYCRSWRISEDGQQNGFVEVAFRFLDAHRWTADFLADGREECRTSFLCTNPVQNASAVVFRRAIFERVGGADENLRLCGDWKLWAAMAYEGKIAYLSEPLNYHRSHDESVRSKSNRTGLDSAEALQVIRWLLSRSTPTEAVWETLRWSAGTYWPWAIVNPRVSLDVKRAIWKDATAIDPHATGRVFRTAMTAVRLKVAKEGRVLRQRFEAGPS